VSTTICDNASLTHLHSIATEAVAAARERLAWRGEALQALLAELLSSCFTLLNRLSEVGARGRSPVLVVFQVPCPSPEAPVTHQRRHRWKHLDPGDQAWPIARLLPPWTLSPVFYTLRPAVRPPAQAESRVRLLQLVSVVAEAAGEALRPHLGALAASLPQVWEAATAAARRPDADTGSVARLHSALMAVLTHLVGKLRGAALSDPGVQGVLYPLLQYATDPGSSEADVLLEEALKLWAVVQGATPTVSQPLVDLLPRMAALLRRGRDNTAAFQLIEGYLLLGGGAALQPYGEAIAAALTAALNGVARTVADACAPTAVPAGAPPGMPQPPGQLGPPAQRQGGPKGSLASEVTQEGLAAAALVDVFLQVRAVG
jgi:hypothetical protein